MVFAFAFFCFPIGDSLGGGWDPRPLIEGIEAVVPGTGQIERIGGDELDRFYAEYWTKKPVIIVRATAGDLNAQFRERTTRQALLEQYGNVSLTLSSANTNSYNRRLESLSDYVRTRMGMQNISHSGVDTWYQFGDNAVELERTLLVHYEQPTRFMKHVENAALSFGLAGTGSGVPMHTHAAVFAEVLYGAKRWFLTRPDFRPDYNGSENMLYWFTHRLPKMSHRHEILDGICRRGDLIYLPSFWYHSTLNIGQTVFMSTFI